VERNHNLNFIDPLYKLLNGVNHGLSKRNLRKYQLRCKFWQLFWMKFIYFSAILIVATPIATVYSIIYILQDYNFYFIIILMFFILAFYVLIEVVSIFSLGVIVIYCTALYLRLRFQQITKQFQRISAENLKSLQSLIREHNRVSLLTKDCDLVISKFFGVLYFYGPFIVNLLLCTTIYGKSSIYIRSLTALLAIFTSIGMYLLSYIPTQVSTEAHRSYNTINSINARYQIQLQTKFKVRLFRKQLLIIKNFILFLY
jgi:hypothetical protein